MAAIFGSMVPYVKSNTYKLKRAMQRLMERTLPIGFVVEGKREAIPLVALDVWKLLDVDERKAYCDALVKEVFLPPVNPLKVNRVELASEMVEDIDVRRYAQPTSKRNIKVKREIPETGPWRHPSTNTWYLNYAAWEYRPKTLVLRLRSIIKQKRQRADVVAHIVKNRKSFESPYVDLALPEMESNEGPPESLVSSSNVVLGETQKESVDIADTDKPASWYQLSSSEENPDYNNLTDRFTFWKSLQWRQGDTSYMMGAMLPIDFISSYSREHMPMFVPFHIHQYFRGDIEIKLQVNSNKFQAGQLICSWYYGALWSREARLTLPEMIQLPHVIISAGASNEATLTIPYRHYVSYLRTKKQQGYSGNLNMGLLSIRALVPLSTSANGSKECSVAIFIRFKNSSFTGLVDGTVLPEMDVVGTILKGASTLLNAPNCDNPPDNTPPQFLVPTASHSWSIGNGLVAPLHRLALQNNIGLRHTQDTVAEDLHYTNIVNKFGLLSSISWNSSDEAMNKTGALLWSCNVHPQIDKHLLYSDSSAQGLTKYYVPPCGVVSSLFEYWRGSLEFKFDIVATSFHTGRLLVAYVPGVFAQKPLSIEQARNSSHIVFSLQDSSTFTFKVPYISDRPWWKRKYGGPQRRSEAVSPSAIFMYVLNPLIPMESVAKAITIVPYVRAGIDFELSVPVQPAIGLADNISNIAPSQPKVTFKEGYFPVYAGAWHSFFESKKYILRYGETSDHVAQVTDNPKADMNHAYIWELVQNRDLTMKVRDLKNRTIVRKYVTHGVIISDNGYNYMIPFTDGAMATRAAWGYKHGWPIQNIAQYLHDFIETGASSPGNLTWRGVEKLDPVSVAFPEMEREFAPNIMSPTSVLKSTRSGLITFGENFSDLKDLLRRYQLYWDGIVQAPTSAVRDYALLQIPICPSGLNLDISNSRPMWNSSREGHIPIISSAYRFYRGGLRLRIIVSNYKGIVWVQYRPDRPLDHDRVARTGSDILAADRYRNHSYPFYIQDMAVNRVIECEIPYYQPGIFGICGNIHDKYLNTDIINFSTLGDFVVGVEGSSIPNDMQIAVYYSVADDFSFNTYVGFPPVVYSDETVFPEMEFISGFTNTVVGTLLGRAVTTPVTSQLRKFKKDTITEIVAEAQSQIEPHFKKIREEGVAGMNAIKDTLQEGTLKQTLINAIGQLLQVMINPSPSSLAIALCSLVGSLVIVSLELFLKLQQLFTDFLKSIWYKFFVSTSHLPEVERTACPEGDMGYDKDYSISLFSTLFGLVCTTLGFSARMPKNWPAFTKGMKEDLGLANNATLFFKNSIEAIIYCYEYLIGESSEVTRAKRVVSREYPSLEAWVKEVLDLLDPRRRRKISQSTREANRVFDACSYGGLIIQANLDKHCPSGKIIFDLYIKICKLRDDLVEGGNHPNVRFEPFSVYVVGAEGIGKSFVTSKVCKELLQAINYRSSEEMIYWLQLGQKYWNGIGNPPVVARDEAYAIDGQFTDEEIQIHMAMCSSSVFNPPMAAVEEKNKRINPLIYYMNSNVEFPTFINARCPKAIYRRRKLLVRANFSERIKEQYPDIVDASQLPSEELVDCNHLVFDICLNPKDVASEWRKNLTYVEFMQEAKKRFVRHYEDECVNFKRRMHDNYCLDPDFDDSDDMEFIQELARTQETLKERMEADRARCEQIIDDDELENNSFIREMMSKAKAMYSKVFSEVDPVPSTSTGVERSDLNRVQCGFYSQERREQIELLMKRANLDKAVAQKLLSGTDIDILTEDDIADFSIMEDFMPIVENPKRKYSHWIGTHDSAMFPVGGSQKWGASEIGHGDKLFMGRWSASLMDKWTNLSGMSALRSYVFWLARQSQWLDILSKYNLEEEIAKVNSLYREEIDEDALGDISLDDLNCEDIPFNIPPSQHVMLLKRARRIQILLSYLKRCGFSKTVCEHSKIWCENIKDLSKLKYNLRHRIITYQDSIGLNFTCDFQCNCENHFARLFNNKLFRRAMKILWCIDHKINSDNITNPFRMEEYDEMKDQASTFLERLKLWFVDWWEISVSPKINCIIRFVRDHVLTILVTLLGIFAIYKTVVRTPEPCTQNYAPEHRDFSFSESEYYKQGGVPKRSAPRQQPAHRENDKGDCFVEKKILDNTCFIRCQYFDGKDYKEIKGRCLGIRNRQVLVIKHYIEEFSRFKDIAKFFLVFTRNGKEAVVNLGWEDFKDIRWLKINKEENSSNFGILELPAYIPPFKNIVKYIPTSSMHKNVRSEADFISVNGPTRRGIRVEQQDFLRIAGIEENGELVLDLVYRYGHHGFGLCGSVLVNDSINGGNLGIFAMHVAGRNGIGYAEPLCREWFDICLPKLDHEYILPVLEEQSNANIELEGNMLFYGHVKPQFAHKESGKTRIVPSLLHNQIYQAETEPNPLRPNDPRQPPGSHPLRDGCNKHGSGFPMKFNEDFLHLVDIDAREVLINKCRPVLAKLEIFNLQDAICGNTRIPYCDALNWNSSEGFPLSAYRPKSASSKKWLFDLEESSDGLILKDLHPRLADLLHVRHTLREKSIISPSIYVDCLKDYRLTPEKCAQPGKTRIFSIAPVQTTIDVRRYLGNFLCSYKNGCIRAEHGIGINAQSMQWTDLVLYLTKIGSNIVTGDYANFGPTLSSQIVMHCLDNILYWHEFYDASPDHIFHLKQILYSEIMTPFHMCADLVYQPLNGIGSGSPITAELNSEVNKHYIKYAWLDIWFNKNKEYATMEMFHKHVRVVTYGDDFIMSVSDEVKDIFNCATIAACLCKYGIRLTSADKGSEIVPYSNLCNSTFLKRSFRKHPTRANVWLAPIEKRSVTECLNWCHKSEDLRGATLEVVRASLDLAYSLGPEFYTTHRDKINQALILHDLEVDLKDWHTKDKEVFG